MSPITTILLDLDDTILHDRLATEIAFDAVRSHAVDAADIDGDAFLGDVRSIAHDVWWAGPFPEWLQAIGTSEIEGLRARFEGADPHWEEMRTFGPRFRAETWRRALEANGSDDLVLAQDLDHLFERARSEANPFMDGAEEILAALKGHYRLGMVTNGIPDVQRKKIDATGLADSFDVIVISGEFGVGKPKPEIFQHALQALGSSPDETIMIGDNFGRDVVGGANAGIRGVWLALERDLPEPDIAWRIIDDIQGLPDILATP